MKTIHVVGSIMGGLVALVILLVILVAGGYTNTARLSQGATKAGSQVANVMQRRYDLIPNLVETVKGAAAFEKSTFVEVATARAAVGQLKVDPSSADPKQLQAYAAAQQGLGTALSRLMVVAEKYPELKADQNFRDLQAQLEGTENRISVERRNFNDAVERYNNSIVSPFGKLVAAIGNYQLKPYFELVNDAAKTAPAVKF